MEAFNVLVVDDDAATRKLLVRVLEKDGYCTTAVSTGEKALEYLDAGPFDLVLMDIHMSGMDGLEVLQTITQKRPHLKHISCIMMSSDGAERRMVRSIELGADDFIVKPIVSSVVLDRVRKAATLARERRTALMSGPGTGPGSLRGPPDSRHSHLLNVLAVDDMPSILRYLSKTLTKYGYTVTLAESGERALQIIREKLAEREACASGGASASSGVTSKQPVFDVLLLDIIMPGMQGGDVIKQLKAGPEALSSMPIIVMSSLDDPDTAAECFALGADDHLSKPFKPEVVHNRISACLAKTRLRSWVESKLGMLVGGVRGGLEDSRGSSNIGLRTSGLTATTADATVHPARAAAAGGASGHSPVVTAAAAAATAAPPPLPPAAAAGRSHSPGSNAGSSSSDDDSTDSDNEQGSVVSDRTDNAPGGGVAVITHPSEPRQPQAAVAAAVPAPTNTHPSHLHVNVLAGSPAASTVAASAAAHKASPGASRVADGAVAAAARFGPSAGLLAHLHGAHGAHTAHAHSHSAAATQHSPHAHGGAGDSGRPPLGPGPSMLLGPGLGPASALSAVDPRELEALVAARVAEAEATLKRRYDKNASRMSSRVRELEGSVADMQKTMRALSQENRQLKKQAGHLYEHERELSASVRAQQARIRQLLVEATGHGYIPSFYTPSPYAPNPLLMLRSTEVEAEEVQLVPIASLRASPDGTARSGSPVNPAASGADWDAAVALNDGRGLTSAALSRLASSTTAAPANNAPPTLDFVVSDSAEENQVLRALGLFEQVQMTADSLRLQGEGSNAGSAGSSAPVSRKSSGASVGSAGSAGTASSGGSGLQGLPGLSIITSGPALAPRASATSVATALLRLQVRPTFGVHGHVSPGRLSVRPLYPVGFTLDSPDFARLTTDVCGYPAYFAPLLFRRIRHAAARFAAAQAPSAGGAAVTARLRAAAAALPPGPMDTITSSDFMRFWADGNANGRVGVGSVGDRVSKFWHLVCQPDACYLTPADLRPLVEGLIDSHKDLENIRGDQSLRAAYVTLVLTSLFCSLHGQRSSRISFAELRQSNLVEAFYLVANQTTKNVLPFSISYFEDTLAAFMRLREQHGSGSSSGSGSSTSSPVLNSPGATAETKAEGYITLSSILAASASTGLRLTPFMLSRVFEGVPRPLTGRALPSGSESDSPTSPCRPAAVMNFADYVWFALAEKDAMSDTSVGYWFRCLDVDDDGYLSIDDLRYVLMRKLEALAGGTAIVGSRSSRSRGTGTTKRGTPARSARNHSASGAGTTAAVLAELGEDGQDTPAPATASSAAAAFAALTAGHRGVEQPPASYAPPTRRGTPAHQPVQDLHDLALSHSHASASAGADAASATSSSGGAGLTISIPAAAPGHAHAAVPDPDLDGSFRSLPGAMLERTPMPDASPVGLLGAASPPPGTQVIARKPHGREADQIEARDALLPVSIPHPRPQPHLPPHVVMEGAAATSATAAAPDTSVPTVAGGSSVPSSAAATSDADASSVASIAATASYSAETVWNILCSLIDFVDPRTPGRITPLQIKRSTGAGTAIFDALVTMEPLKGRTGAAAGGGAADAV